MHARRRLQVLSLGSNRLQGTLLPEFGQLVCIEYLTLSNNEFTGTIPAEFGQLETLKELRLDGNRMSGRSGLTALRISMAEAAWSG